MEFLIKHSGKEQYFFKKHMQDRLHECMTFTQWRSDAKRYPSMEAAELDLKWFQDPEYIIIVA
jgi:hypothetical protein